MSDNPVPPPPGYYDDGTGQQRYWDGQQWGQSLPASQTPVMTPTEPAMQGQAAQVKQRNTLGIVALIVAGVGFIFACIPGALIVGWVALPIGFVLAIVALFLRGRGKAMALTALIVSIVGTIIGFVVFFAVVANSFSDAFGGTDSSVVQPSSSAGAKSAEPNSASNVGTRTNPAAIGSQIKSNGYTITINSVNLNATDAVMGANEFNDQPDSGTTYALINATITYTGPKSGDVAEVGFSYVTSSGNVINSYDKLAVGPDPQLSDQELYPGASATGNVVIQVPLNDDGLIRVRPGLIADEIFVKTK